MRVPNKTTKMFNGGIISTTEQPALSIGLDNGESMYVELTDEQVLKIVEDGIYYLGRRARVLFRQQETNVNGGER